MNTVLSKCVIHFSIQFFSLATHYLILVRKNSHPLAYGVVSATAAYLDYRRFYG